MSVQYQCTIHPFETEITLDGLIEHLRRVHHLGFIGRPGALGATDSHGHMWYCFECESDIKDHRSFDSDKAMWNHLQQRHFYSLDDIVRE